MFLSWLFLKCASMASLLSSYSGFQYFCLYFHVQRKIQLQFEELPKLQIGSPVHSLNVTVFKLVGICTSRRLVFLEWKITKIVSGYAISGRVLFQNLAQSCSFVLVIWLVMFLCLFQHADCKTDI